MRHATRAIRLLGFHAGTTRRRAAALRVALDQRDKAIIGQFLVFGAQAPAGGRVVLEAHAQAATQQDCAGVEANTSDKANVLIKRNVRLVVHDDLQLHGRNLPGTVIGTAQRKQSGATGGHQGASAQGARGA